MKFYILNREVTMEDIKTFDYPNQRLGVIAHIENSEGKILLQQRGQMSRDENGLYEDIGGGLEESDTDFKAAMTRELKEEIGNDARIILDYPMGIYHCYKNSINWIFVIYFGRYIEGEIKIMEPTKCLGYDFFTYEEAIKSELVTESCKYLIKRIREIF